MAAMIAATSVPTAMVIVFVAIVIGAVVIGPAAGAF